MTRPVPDVPAPADSYLSMVLLVDDQVMVCEAVRRALAHHPDLDFHYCTDPHEAMEVALRVKPTVILQDLVMPGVDGLDLVRAYRQNPALHSVPVIVLSTKEDPATKSDAFQNGANDYLVKLPDKVELIATALSIKHRVVHATINYRTPDPTCDLDYVPNQPREMRVTKAISNSFGFGGHNCTLVIGAVR